MRRFQIEQRTVVGTILFLTMAGMIGGYRYIQQQRMNDLQQQINQVPAGKEKAALVKDRIALENAIDGSLVQAVGGLLLFVTAYVSLQNLKATQQNVSIAQRNLLVSEEKQVTERFTQAINQLGSEGEDKITIRLGGIYALERIAKDSPKDYWTIIEVLTSFIRETLPISEFALQIESQPTEAQKAKKITTDIQAALIVIGRRETKNDSMDNRVDLSGIDLSSTNLRGASLIGANLNGVDLISANLISANLFGADLISANLFRAILLGTNLSSANLFQANLSGANLSGANLSFANLSGAILLGTNLERTNLQGANLERANLERAKNITPTQIKRAKNWQQALYAPKFYKELGLPPEELF